MRRLGRLQAARYGAEFCNGMVESIEKQADLFVIRAVQADEPDVGAGIETFAAQVAEYER